MIISDKNPNNVGGVGSQSYLASTSLIKNGVNDTAYINILSLNDGSLKTISNRFKTLPRRSYYWRYSIFWST